MTQQIDEFTLRRLRGFADKFVELYTQNPPSGDPEAAGKWANENIPAELMAGDYLLSLREFIHEGLAEKGWKLVDHNVIH